MLVVYCAGPLSSAVFTLVGFSVLFVLHPGIPLENCTNTATAFSVNLWLSFALSNMFLLAAALVPFTLGNYCSDGFMILSILTRTDPWSEAEERRTQVEREPRFRQPVPPEDAKRRSSTGCE
jgi:hypothetical protein